MRKINLKKLFLTTIYYLLTTGFLFYTRFINLGWGLPYPMHPDERNMAAAIQSLNCRLPITDYRLLKDCFNPHFFAYGQFPLYLGRIIVFIMKFFDGDLNTPVGFGEAVIALRIISAVASVISVLMLFKLIDLILNGFMSNVKSQNLKRFTDLTYGSNISHLTFNIIILVILIFNPFMIQFSHFGTTESLLMLLYSLIIYYSLKLITTLNEKVSIKKQVLSIKNTNTLNTKYLILNSFISGLAIATKISATIFLPVPLLAILLNNFNYFKNKVTIVSRLPAQLAGSLFQWLLFLSGVTFFAIIFSPHNLINLNEFLGSMRYEGDVALGRYVAFYTRQFVGSIPVIFQFTKIFPYALGWPQFILAVLGFIFLPWKNKLLNFLRFAFLIYFIPNAFIFAKWSRFMAPVFPILTIFNILFLFKIISSIYSWTISNVKTQMSRLPTPGTGGQAKPNVKSKNLKRFKDLSCGSNILHLSSNIILIGLVILIVTPGIAYLSVYQSPDIRFVASDWIYKNIPSDSYILSETANVVDIPIPSSYYPLQPTTYNLNYISFNFYDLDENPELQQQLQQHLKKADYIFVPSRRIWANHTCQNNTTVIPGLTRNLNNLYYQIDSRLRGNDKKSGNDKCASLQSKYPLLNKYYEDLFSGTLGFTQVAEFSSYPKICLFHASCFILHDERAEETWTVFDHPVIRIYKKNKVSSIKNQVLKDYKTLEYLILNTKYLLLISDTPTKWQSGLMNVRLKEEIKADGMIFTFPQSEKKVFWNKNTLVDLDIYWINNDKIIGKSYLPSIEKTKNIITVKSPGKVDKVIEIIK